MSICLGDLCVMQPCRVLDTDASDIVIGADVLHKNPRVKMLSLHRPYALHCDFDSGLFSVPVAVGTKRVRAALRSTDKLSYRKQPVGLTRP